MFPHHSNKWQGATKNHRADKRGQVHGQQVQPLHSLESLSAIPYPIFLASIRRARRVHRRCIFPFAGFIRILVLAALFYAATSSALQAQSSSSYTHFEARQVHPITLTPDGTRLLAINTPDARLSVFDVTSTTNPVPVLVQEIPIGLESVSVRARTNDEAWVVSEVGDCISIVSLSLACVVRTLPAADEPGDVVFAQNKAFVSCSRNNQVRVFSLANYAELAVIPLSGLYPRAMAVNADGTEVYAAFLHSGNHTTVLPAGQAPAQPAPTNTALPAPPQVGLIVPASDPRIPYAVLDNDVARISAVNHTVLGYFTTVGTSLFDLLPRPGSAELWVTNTEALNLVRFEPNLKGHFVDNRLTRILTNGGGRTFFDLNPGINYAVLPNPPAQAAALAQPWGMVFSSDGSTLWVAAFGSDRVAAVNAADGSVQHRVDVRTGTPVTAATMRGPRGLALLEPKNRLFVLNKLSNTITTIDTQTRAVAGETAVGSFDPMPASLKAGRGYLFDARLSGNGTASCASCHPDADHDGIAWDLGDPGGSMTTVVGYNNSLHDLTPYNRSLHPMKGPMITQTLRGFEPRQTGQAVPLFHWRGDRPSIQSFNVTFADLLGGSKISASDMDALAAYLGTLIHHPNPNRKLDRTLPATIAGGNPTIGRNLYNSHNDTHCAVCHILASGTDQNIDLKNLVGSSEPVKTPPLRTVYQRSFFSGASGAVNITGFGLLKDGTGFDLPIAHFYDLAAISTVQQYTDVKAFVLCFDTGVAPTVGYSLAVNTGNSTATAVTTDLTTLETQARLSGASAACDLVARGRVGGASRSFFYNKTTQLYKSDKASEAERTRAQLLALLGSGDTLTFSGVQPGQGLRQGGDRDADGIPDQNEPIPALTAGPAPGGARISWPAAETGWVLESCTNLQAPWQTVTLSRSQDNGRTQIDDTPGPEGRRFYRLRRTW